MRSPRLFAFVFAVILAGRSVAAPSVAIAAAANLTYALEALNAEFRRVAPDVRVTTALGASGNLYAQIRNGAPFDLFLSADTEYPERLAREGFGDATTLRTFATGRLVLWTTRSDLDLSDIARTVTNPAVAKLAIAQPKTAPYGRAAETALRNLGVWPAVQPKIVIGENISQTAQFVETGNADAGFVALSLVVSSRLGQRGRWVPVSPKLYTGVTLDDTCVLTRQGATNSGARKYLEFLRSDAARHILERYGYAVPREGEKGMRE